MNYDEVTFEDEYRILEDLANEMGASKLLEHPEIYGYLREELNNEMLSRWEEEQEGGAPPPWRIGREYPYSEFENFRTEEYGRFVEGKHIVHIKVDTMLFTFVMCEYCPSKGGVYRCVYAG